jgi:putative copper export protein
VDATDLLLIVMRSLHALAALAWIGAICFELLVGLPALGDKPPEHVLARMDAAMREIVQTSLIVFLVSGALLTFERLSHNAAGSTYVLLLILKIALAVVMFQVGSRLRGARGDRRRRGLRWQAGLGVSIVLLAVILKWIYERALLA